jgi:hypothetical protein
MFKSRRPDSQESLDRIFPEPQMASAGVSRDEAPGSADASTAGLPRPKGASGGNRDQALLAELDAAISDREVDLRHIVIARFAIPDDDSMSSEYTGRITTAKTLYYGNWIIKEVLFCDYIPAAVALKSAKSGSGRLEIEFVYLADSTNDTDPGIEAAVWQARTYYLDADQCGSRLRFNSIARNIFLIIASLLSLADEEALRGHDAERIEQSLPRINDELKQVGTEINLALSVEARHQYLLGMFLGAVTLVAVVIVIRWVAVPDLASKVHIDNLGLETVIAGGLGAVLSVMTRITANNLSVDPTTGKGLVRLAGGFRPLIGGIFAFAIYAFVRGGLLPIKVTVTGTAEIYFFLSVAFLAGFSERFAQDAVTRAGSIISESGPLRQGQ